MKIEEKEKFFSETISNYSDLISKICFYFSTYTDEFKDLRQEVMINLWKGMDQFCGDSELSTWIYRVCFNTCVSYKRKEKKFSKTIPLDDIILTQTEEETLENKEKHRLLNSLIKKLSFQDRAIILMWLDEKSYEEIASLMGMNRNTIAVRLKRIKEKLQKSYSDGK